jgi:hypothetical protein
MSLRLISCKAESQDLCAFFYQPQGVLIMKKVFAVALLAVSVLFAGEALAAEWGYLTVISNDRPADSVFRVNIEAIDGKMNDIAGANVPVSPGTHVVKVSLVFNDEWGAGMGQTADNIYYDEISVDVAAKETYFLGAKVNLKATAEEQASGSFWEAIVVSER